MYQLHILCKPQLPEKKMSYITNDNSGRTLCIVIVKSNTLGTPCINKDGGAWRTFKGVKKRFGSLIRGISLQLFTAGVFTVPFRLFKTIVPGDQFDNQLTLNFVAFTIVFMSIKNYESVN